MPDGARGRHLGLDVGDRRIGVALSDETATLASALTTLTRSGGRKDAALVADLARRHEVSAVVVGLPLNMDGTRGPQAEKVLGFVEGLRGGWGRCPRHTRRAPHHGRSGGEAARGRHGLEGAKGRGGPGGGGRDPPGVPRRTSAGGRVPRPEPSPACASSSSSSSWPPWPTARGSTRRSGPCAGPAIPPQPLLVAQGAGVLDIGRQLQQLGLVRHPRSSASTCSAGRRRAGCARANTRSRGSMSLEQIVDKLVRGDVVRHTVTFPEGTNLEDMARLAGAKGIPVEPSWPPRATPSPSGPRSGRQGPRGLSLSRHLRHPARPRAGGPARGAHGPALPHGDGAELPGCPAAARCARS
jgi:hypothetical protein